MRRHTLHRAPILLLSALALAMAGGCDKSITPPEPPVPPAPPAPPAPTWEPRLETSKLSLAIPGGWTESFTVNAVDRDLNAEQFSVTSGNAAVATVARSGNTVTVTAVANGSTTLTISSNSGNRRDVPVRVYDPRIMETDELLITYALEFGGNPRYGRWDQAHALGFWHPVTTDGFKPLGTLAVDGNPSSHNPRNRQGVPVVKAKPGSNALAAPTDYQQIMRLRQHNTPWEGTVWRPVPPAGYVALGLVVTRGTAKPALDEVVTVRQDLTTRGSASTSPIFSVRDVDQAIFGTERRYRVWEIMPPAAEFPHGDSYLPTGTFVFRESGSSSWASRPSEDAVMRVLKIQFPLLVQPASFENYRPRFTGCVGPEESVPIAAREVLVPSFMLARDWNDRNRRVVDSPFYRLERQVYYQRRRCDHNTTAVTQTAAYEERKGIEESVSNTVWQETSVMLSVDGGVAVKMVDVGFTASVSRTMGYSTSTSVSALRYETFTTNITIPPATTGAIFQSVSRFVLKRHDEQSKTLVTVRQWDVPERDYVTVQYPPAP
jgi:hypothetical protein